MKRTRVPCLILGLLVLLNGDDDARKHLHRLFGIARISDREGTCCQGNQFCREASHGDGLPHFKLDGEY